MEYLQMSQVGIITATLVTMLIYFYLYFLYRERYMGWWLIVWMLYIFRIIFFDTDYITWNKSVIGFIIYQMLYIIPAYLTIYVFHIFTGKDLKNKWLYSSIITAILSIVVTLLQLPHPYKLAPPLWLAGIMLIYTGKILLDIKTNSIGNCIIGVTFIFWGLLTFSYPFIHYSKISLLAGPISGVLRLVITSGILVIYFEKTRANFIKYQESLEKVNLELQQTNQELNHFCHSVAHDFKSPLLSINQLAKLMVRDHYNKLDDDGKELITHIKNSSAKVITITDHLLELSRMSNKQIKKEPVALEDLFWLVYSRLRQLGPTREVECTIAELPRVYGDPIMLEILITNILDNALKYTRYREQAIIDVSFSEEEDHYIIAVKDNGAGFNMEDAPRLFQVLERLHGADEFEGTGIGLVTCQKILKRHGGKAWMIGKEDEGATFFFSFPKDKRAISTNYNETAG